jgi:uncharacterized protein (DUF2141 family)
VFTGIPAGTYAVAVFHAEHNETQSNASTQPQGLMLATRPSQRY